MSAVSVNVQLPAGLHLKLKRLAELDGRSLDQQILHLIEQAPAPLALPSRDWIHGVMMARSEEIKRGQS